MPGRVGWEPGCPRLASDTHTPPPGSGFPAPTAGRRVRNRQRWRWEPVQSGPSPWPSCAGRPLRPGPAEEFPEEEAYVLVRQGSELHGGAHGPRVPVP